MGSTAWGSLNFEGYEEGEVEVEMDRGHVKTLAGDEGS